MFLLLGSRCLLVYFISKLIYKIYLQRAFSLKSFRKNLYLFLKLYEPLQKYYAINKIWFYKNKTTLTVIWLKIPNYDCIIKLLNSFRLNQRIISLVFSKLPNTSLQHKRSLNNPRNYWARKFIISLCIKQLPILLTKLFRFQLYKMV